MKIDGGDPARTESGGDGGIECGGRAEEAEKGYEMKFPKSFAFGSGPNMNRVIGGWIE